MASPILPYTPSFFKQCATCNELKPATREYFHADKSKKGGLASTCKICARARARLWGNTHRERRQLWHATHREQANTRSRLWRKKHPEQTKVNNRLWRATHREQQKTHNRNHHARKHGAKGTHNAIDALAQYRRQRGKCYYCNHKMKPYGWKESCALQPTEDHVIPLSRGGSNGPENLVIACRECNERKHTKMPHEWPEGGRLL